MSDVNDQENRTRTQLHTQLVNEQLSEVAFVQDYLELHFDGPKLTCYVSPTLQVRAETVRQFDDRYRNLLCGYIAQVVYAINYVESQHLTIIFANEDSISLNLDPSNPEIVAEIGIFWDADGGMWIFD